MLTEKIEKKKFRATKTYWYGKKAYSWLKNSIG
jgi:hypothetical protein